MPAPASAERTIRWLAIPTVLIALAAIIVLPWLLETRHRLQNDYWENQLAFAFTALAVAAAGVPFFCLRCVRPLPVLVAAGMDRDGIRLRPAGYFHPAGPLDARWSADPLHLRHCLPALVHSGVLARPDRG